MIGRKLIAVVLAVGVVLGVGVLVWAPGADDGDAGAPTTTTPAPTTTTPPATTPTTTTATTTTPEPTATPTTTPTPTATPSPDFEATANVSTTEVYDGEATLSITVTNAGTGGDYAGVIKVDRHDGDWYDMSAQVGGYVGPNSKKTFTYRIDFDATGEYTVSLDGATVAQVSVHGLRTHDYGSSGGDSDNGGSITPVVNGSVDGEASAG